MKQTKNHTSACKLSTKGRKLKEQWIDALESGRYKQGIEFLRKRDEDSKQLHYCCLGVLLNIYDKAQWESHETDEDRDPNVYTFEGEDGSLPEKVRKLVGLSAVDITSLITLNDDYETSFKEIAERIKKNDFSLPTD